MRSRLSRVILSAVGAGMLAASLLASPVAAVHAGEVIYDIQLTGAAEVPSPGSPSGWGRAQININEAKQRVCWNLWEGGTDTPTAAHIHVGGVAEAGPVVLPLSAPTTGYSTGCM